MSREHDRRRPIGKLSELRDQLRARGRVETGRRLVEEEPRGSVRSSTAMLARFRCPPLRVPTRTSAWSASPTASMAPATAASISALVVDDGSRSRAAYRSVCSQREIGVDDVVLGHVADHPAELRQVRVDVDAVEAHRARALRGDAGDRAEQRRLARTAGTDDGDQLSGGDRERHAVQQRDLAPTPHPDAPGQVIDADAEPSGLAGRHRRRCCTASTSNDAVFSLLQCGHGLAALQPTDRVGGLLHVLHGLPVVVVELTRRHA